MGVPSFLHRAFCWASHNKTFQTLISSNLCHISISRRPSTWRLGWLRKSRDLAKSRSALCCVPASQPPRASPGGRLRSRLKSIKIKTRKWEEWGEDAWEWTCERGGWRADAEINFLLGFCSNKSLRKCLTKTLAMASLYFGVSSPRNGEAHMWANENYLSPPNAGATADGGGTREPPVPLGPRALHWARLEHVKPTQSINSLFRGRRLWGAAVLDA